MTEEVQKSAPITAPKNPQEVRELPSLKTSEASDSYSKFINENLAHIEGYQPISSEQAWALINCYRAWQSSPERKEELVQVKAAKAQEAEAAKEARALAAAEKKAAKDAADKAKAEKKALKDAADAAKAAGDDSDIPTDGEAPAPKRRRPPAKAAESAEGVSAGTI